MYNLLFLGGSRWSIVGRLATYSNFFLLKCAVHGLKMWVESEVGRCQISVLKVEIVRVKLFRVSARPITGRRWRWRFAVSRSFCWMRKRRKLEAGKTWSSAVRR